MQSLSRGKKSQILFFISKIEFLLFVPFSSSDLQSDSSNSKSVIMSFLLRRSTSPSDLESVLPVVSPVPSTVVSNRGTFMQRLRSRIPAHNDVMGFLLTALVVFVFVYSDQMTKTHKLISLILAWYFIFSGFRHRNPLPPGFRSSRRWETLRLLDLADQGLIDLGRGMTDQEINALPVHQYQGKGSSAGQASSSNNVVNENGRTTSRSDGRKETVEDEFTCSICLEEVNLGELIKTLPCSHQFHASCVYPWLHQKGSCPLCKSRVLTLEQLSGEGDADVDHIV